MTNNINEKAEASRPEAAMLPSVDVIENVSGICVYADLPGVSKDGLNVGIEGDALTIEGHVHLPNLPENMQSTHAEVRLPSYRRVFTLSKELDTEKVTAEFEQGVLKLIIPKAAHAQPKKIQIQLTK